MTIATPTGIQQLQLAYFGRPSDPAALTAWPASGLSIEAIVLQLVRSAEYQRNTVDPNSTATAGGSRTFNDTNLINSFYLRLFGRLAAGSEVAGWSSALARGATDYDYLGLTILNAGLNLPTTGAAGEMRAVLVAKVQSNDLYSGILFNNPASAAAYSTAAAIQDGIAYSSVTTTSTPQTLVQAQAAVATMVTSSGAGGGQTFTLTTGINTETAATFNGIVGVAGGANTTLNTGDTLTGSTGTVNTLNLTGLGTAAAGAIATVTNVPTINYRGVGNNGNPAAFLDQINQLLITGTTQFASNQSISDVAVINGKLATTYALNNTVSTGAGVNNNPDLTVTYAATELAGTTDTALFSANNAGVINAAETAFSTFTVGNAATGVATTALERVQVTTAGSNNIALTLNSDVTRINGAGSGTNLIAVAGNNATSLIDFSASTGTNSYQLNAGLTTNDSVTGGTGSDTVRATLAGVAGGLVFTGVETLRLNAGSAGTAVFTTATGLVTIDNRSGNQTNVITGAGALTTVGFVGAVTAAAQNVGVLTLSTALAGAADTLAVNFSNGGTAATAYTATLNVSGAETLNITTTDATVGVANNLTLRSSTGTTQTGTTSLSFTSAGGYTLANGTGATTATAGGSLTSLNASGVAGAFNSGNLAANSFASGATITLGAGAGGNTLTLGNEAATDTIAITGGAGADNVVVGTGIFTANLGGGADIFNGFAATQLNVQGGDGADTIIASQGADTIIGNAGANTYQFAIGLAAVTAVAKVDSITLANAFAAGDRIVTTLNGVQATYTVTAADVAGADTAADIVLIRASLIPFLNGMFGTTITATAAAGAGVITVTADVAGTAFTLGTTQIAAAGTATQAAVTANTAGVAGANSTSNTGALDLLTYVTANADVIDATTSAGPGNAQALQAGAGTAGNVTVGANGLVSFGAVVPTSLLNAFTLVEAANQNGGFAAGDSAAFVFNGQAYLFVSDATAGFTTSDVAVQLTGFNTLATGLTFAGNDITAIA